MWKHTHITRVTLLIRSMILKHLCKKINTKQIFYDDKGNEFLLSLYHKKANYNCIFILHTIHVMRLRDRSFYGYFKLLSLFK